MPSTCQKLEDKKLIYPPKFLSNNIQYETIMGSVAYGVAGESSDIDIYGFTIPPKGVVFPHLDGHIHNFGRHRQEFSQFEAHHVEDKDNRKMYDITIYNIVKYFQLCMENNPNMIDSLFTPTNCVLHITRVGNIVRENRHKFLHKGCWPKFKGYAYSQLHKMGTAKENTQGNRRILREKYGFDVKFAMHVVRLLDEAEQILTNCDIDLQRNREQLKAIRRGEISEKEIRKWATAKELQLEKVYTKSKLPYGPNENEIKTILLNCLEEHYGGLKHGVVLPDMPTQALRKIMQIVDDYRR